MARWALFTCIAALAASCAAAPAAEPAARPITLRFEPETTCQTFEGWGIVLPCWLFRRAKTPEEAARLYDAGPARSNRSGALNAALAAEMAFATLKHLTETFDLAVDYWSVLNEPGNGSRPGNPKLCAELTAATGKRIAAEGFRAKMSGPECVTPRQVDAYMKAMAATPGALDHFAQITYHLYWDPMTVTHRRTIRDWARKLKVTAAQTEWMEQKDLNVCEHIFLCLTEADAVAWERYAWDVATDVRRQTFRRKSTAWYVRQYSRYIRPGAIRVKMLSPTGRVKPVAFLSLRKKPVIVLLNTDARPWAVTLTHLPPGRYEHHGVGGGRIGKVRTARVGERGELKLDLPAKSVRTITADPPAPGPIAR